MFRKIPQYLLVAINILLSVAMVVCAFSQYIHPHEHPDISFLGMLFPVFLVLTLLFVFIWIVTPKRKLSLISITAMLICAGSIRTYCPVNWRSTPPPEAIKVISYNVMGMNSQENWHPETSTILQFLLSQDADIVCLQESSSYFDSWKSLTTSTYPYQKLILDKGVKLSVLSKFPILSCERLDYESVNNCSYALTLAVEKKKEKEDDGHRNAPDTLLLINNHLESYKLAPQDREDYKDLIRHPEGYEAVIRHPHHNAPEEKSLALIRKINAANAIRSSQADSVAKYVDTHPYKYAIVCGDFNDSPMSYTHYRLTRHLNDSYTRGGLGPGFSYNKSGMFFRIDNILVSPNISVCKSKIDTYSKISDHYPIISWLILQ